MADAKLSTLPSLAVANIDLTEELYIIDGGVPKRVTVAEIRKAMGLYTARLASDDGKTSTTTAKVTGLDLPLPVGSWVFEYFLRYQCAATGTGIKLDVNFSGTVTSFVWNQQWTDASATAATATPSGSNIQAAGAVLGSFSSRAKGTAGRGVTLGVDAATSDLLMYIQGIAEVTVAGNMELYAATEVAASAATVKAGSALRCQRIFT
jgi:hypothetical protein